MAEVIQSESISMKDPELASPPSRGVSETSSEGNAGLGHYTDSHNVLQLEYMGEKHMRFLILSVRLAFVAGISINIGLLVYKQSGTNLLLDRNLPRANVIIAGLCCCGLYSGACWLAYRVYRALRSGKTWSIRRRRNLTLTCINVTAMSVLATFVVIPNAYILARHCAWFDRLIILSGFVRWTCWNALFFTYNVVGRNALPWKKKGHSAQAIMDAPLYHHWPVAVLCTLQQGLLIYIAFRSAAQPQLVLPPEDLPLCIATRGAAAMEDPPRISLACSFTDHGRTMASLLQLPWVALIVMFCYNLWAANASLKRFRYQDMRVAHFMLRLNARLRLLGFASIAATLLLLWWISTGVCNDFSLTWLGMLGPLVVFTVVTMCEMSLSAPKLAFSAAPMTWTQHAIFAWTERDRPKQLAKRSRGCQCPHAKHDPIFCFETALKAFYWSALAYEFNSDGSAGNFLTPEMREVLDLEGAMATYALDDCKVFHDPASETKAIVAWRRDLSFIVVSFRGSAAKANFVADLKALRTPHPPKRGSFWRGTQPLVHTGFLRTWQANGFHKKVIQDICGIFCDENRCVPMTSTHVLATGHSLGGALATLAVMDLARELRLQPHQLSVYTFGAPRTGNHAFSREYNNVAPDTWHVINDQDMVTRMAKFVTMYKRPGKRCIIDRGGKLLVSPTYIENSLLQLPFMAKVTHHYLQAYKAALVGVLRSQLDTKRRADDGVAGLLGLIEALPEMEGLLGEDGLFSDARAMLAPDLRSLFTWRGGASRTDKGSVHGSRVSLHSLADTGRRGTDLSLPAGARKSVSSPLHHAEEWVGLTRPADGLAAVEGQTGGEAPPQPSHAMMVCDGKQCWSRSVMHGGKPICGPHTSPLTDT